MFRSVRSGFAIAKFQKSKGLFKNGGIKSRSGLIEDLIELRDKNGKRFIAQNELLSVKEAVLFPRISGRTLSGNEITLPCSNHIQLVLVSMRELGQKMCDMYRRPFEESLSEVAVYELCLVDHAIFRMFHKWIQRNLLQIIPKERHSSFVCYTGDGSITVKELTKTIHYGNSLVGHAFLVDKNSLIRWKATAQPTQQELKAMIKCTKQLLSSE